MTSATKGFKMSSAWTVSFDQDSAVLSEAAGPVPSPVSKQLLQHPLIIVAISFLLFPMSPFLMVSKPGMSPGFLTMNAINSEGSPPMLKNSSPFSCTNLWNTGCVASLTRCPYVSFSTLPKATKGCTSPRDPTTCITTFMGGGGGTPFSPPRLGGMYAGGGGPWLFSVSC